MCRGDVVWLVVEKNLAHHHTMLTQYFREVTRVNSCDAWHLFTFQPVSKTFFCVPMRICSAVVAHDDGLGMDFLTFHERGDTVLLNAERRHAIVADKRVGEHHHLTSIRRVGQTLWVAHHRCVEDHFTSHRLFVTERLTVERCAVF